MNRAARLLALTFLLLACAFGSGGWSTSAAEPTPVDAWNDLDDALFAVQAGLLSSDQAAMDAALADASAAADAYLAFFPVAEGSSTDINATLTELATAAHAGDQVEVARLRGVIHGQTLVISYSATEAAIAAGDASTARQWMLVRTFTQSTRLARPSADSTVALEQFANGAQDASTTWAIVSADLLDTYQAEVQRQIDELAKSTQNTSQLSVAESIGQIQALWPLFAESYEQQLGSDARSQLQLSIDGLTVAGVQSDPSQIQALDTAFGNFRAAPLSLEEQSGRARQMVLYLGLVPKEYSRGVRGGEVTSSIEIQEAATFLTGAKAAFADLRPSLNQVDPATTQLLNNQINALGALIDTALQGGTPADPDEISAATSAVEDTFRSVVPGEWLKAGGDADFDVVISLLEQMEAAAAAGQFKQAESARLEAYAVFDAGAEKRLLAFAPSLAQQIETGFWQGNESGPGLATLIANEAPIGEITKARQALVNDLTQARQQLGSGSTAKGAIIFNAGSIVFREGLEAVLILASLMASMTGANRVLKKPLALGSALALAATVVLFILARTVLLSLSAYSERVEAIVSLIAIGVLLLVMNWFFHKVYWTKWIAKHHQKRRMILGGVVASQAFGLVLLGFTSVFREGAETVLFLQALVLDAGTQVVIEGVALGLLATFVVGFLMFALQAKLPHKKMLIVTGFMISLVLVTMVGKTVHILQAVGWMPIHPISDTPPPYWTSLWLGIYNTWEGLIGQLVALVFVFGSYFAAEHSHKRAQRELMARVEAAPTAMAGD